MDLRNMFSNFHDYTFYNKRDIHVQKMYVKNVFFTILRIFQWQPFCPSSHWIYHQIGFIFDCLMIYNIYYFLGKHFIHTSVIEALQFTLLPPLSILKGPVPRANESRRWEGKKRQTKGWWPKKVDRHDRFNWSADQWCLVFPLNCSLWWSGGRPTDLFHSILEDLSATRTVPMSTRCRLYGA